MTPANVEVAKEKKCAMAGDRLQVGDTEIITITDAECSLPFTFAQLYAGVDPARWAPYRERYPGTFEGPDHWRVHFGGTLIKVL